MGRLDNIVARNERANRRDRRRVIMVAVGVIVVLTTIIMAAFTDLGAPPVPARAPAAAPAPVHKATHVDGVYLRR